MDDTDIINCICGKEKDDGFMIQCEQCLEWQHGSCVHIKQNHVPIHYFCQNCKKGSKLYRKDKVMKQKKRKIKRAIYSSSEEEEEEEEEEDEEEDERKVKFVETSKNMTQDTEVGKLLHRVKKQWLQLQKSKETGEKADESIVKGFESFVTMDGDSLAPSIPKASARPLQRSLRGASFSSQKDPSVQKGIFADIHIPEERYLLEIVGKMVLKSEYKGSETGYQKMDIPARHVFFFRSLDLCVDARQYGNDGRFLRRSCRPNAEIKSVITPPHLKKKQQQDGDFIHMGIYTRKEVDRGQEITLGWGWQRNHFVAKKKQEFMKNKDAAIDFDDKMRAYIQNMLPLLKLEYGDCACLDKDECFIEFLKEEMENNPPPPPPKKVKVSQSTTTAVSPSSSSSSSVTSSHQQQQQQQKQQHISKKQKINSTNRDTTNNNTDESSVVASTLSSTSTLHAKKEINKERNIIPPSPAGSVEDNDTGLQPKLPAKKRWLQSYQRRMEQKSLDSYPSDSSSSENNIPLSGRKKLSLENYWNQRRN